MLAEEHGFPRHQPEPLGSAIATFLAFVAVGFLPLAPYVVDIGTDGALAGPFAWSTTLTGAAFVGIGIARLMIVDIARWRGALETLLVGGAAALLAFVVESLLQATI